MKLQERPEKQVLPRSCWILRDDKEFGFYSVIPPYGWRRRGHSHMNGVQRTINCSRSHLRLWSFGCSWAQNRRSPCFRTYPDPEVKTFMQNRDTVLSQVTWSRSYSVFTGKQSDSLGGVRGNSSKVEQPWNAHAMPFTCHHSGSMNYKEKKKTRSLCEGGETLNGKTLRDKDTGLASVQSHPSSSAPFFLENLTSCLHWICVCFVCQWATDKKANINPPWHFHGHV